MNPATSLLEQLALSTVRIECTLASGGSSVGTGFFFDISTDPQRRSPAIVTNKHVVQDAIRCRFHLTNHASQNNPNYDPTTIIEFDDLSVWKPHPDETVDLCVLWIAGTINRCFEEGRHFSYRVFTQSLIPTDEDMQEFCAGSNILMVGYPNGVWDNVNNMPIFRRGITATHIKHDFQGRPEFLIDAACFPGSSGSPVLAYDPGLNIQGDEYIATRGQGPRLKLLGILWGGLQFDIDGELKIVHVPTSSVPIVRSRVPMNLGAVIKSHRLLDFCTLCND